MFFCVLEFHFHREYHRATFLHILFPMPRQLTFLRKFYPLLEVRKNKELAISCLFSTSIPPSILKYVFSLYPIHNDHDPISFQHVLSLNYQPYIHPMVNPITNLNSSTEQYIQLLEDLNAVNGSILFGTFRLLS